MAFLANGRAPKLEHIDFCIDKGITQALQSTVIAAFTDTIQAITRTSP